MSKAPFRIKDLGDLCNSDLSYIGRPILDQTNIYFDLSNSGIWFIEQNRDLQKIEVNLKEFERVPFNLEKCGIILKIGTDLGALRLIVDTGATLSVLNQTLLEGKALSKDSFGNSCFLSNVFVLGDWDYGEKKLYPLDISPKLDDFDGILGMDFLKTHAFYIDYQNRFIYFQKKNSLKNS